MPAEGSRPGRSLDGSGRPASSEVRESCPKVRHSGSTFGRGAARSDLGTLPPRMLGTMAVVGLTPMPVVLGFAVSYIATALWYRLPIPVQPMKAVAAVLLTSKMTRRPSLRAA